MPLLLAGEALPLPTVEMCKWVRENIPIEKAVPFLDRAWPGSLLASRGIAHRSRPRAPRSIELNTLNWPTGADRFALGFFFCSAEIASKIRNTANGPAGLTSDPILLEMSAEGQASAEKLSAQVMLLKIIPLTSIPIGDFRDSNNPVLLVVVDDRYAWQTVPCPDFGIPAYGQSLPPSSGGTSATVPRWQDLLDMCAQTLGVAFVVDPIQKSYLSPDPSLNVSGAPLGIVLEAIVRNNGCRLSRAFDGTIRIIAYDTSDKIRLADQAANPLRSVRAGGNWFANDL